MIDTLKQKTESHIISTSMSFGISNHLSMSASVPLIINRSVNKSLDQSETNFGDLSVTAQVFFGTRLFSKPVNGQLALGTTFPVGGGVTNVITDERNFASGTVDPIASLIIAAGVAPGWILTGKFFARQVVTSSSDNQRTGNHYTYVLETNYAPIGRSYTANFGMLAVSRSQDEIGGVSIQNSGGDWVYAIAGGSKTLVGAGESAVRIWTEFQLPVHVNVTGVQLTEKWNLRFGLSTGISIFGHDEQNNKKGIFSAPGSKE
ncbi:MAG: hypothetical protein IH931_03155 [candidate division Zixibacteria bacterium]|nr:hypothetical protein [candidate division Zixibacteria bacterium]